MKKTKKILLGLSTSTLVGAIAPTAFISCSSEEDTRIDVNTLMWTGNGTYDAIDSDDDVLMEFEDNNKIESDGGQLPNDIYSNVDLSITGLGASRQVIITAKSESQIYKGIVHISVLGEKIDIATYNWNTSATEYHAAMTEDDIVAMFKQLNPAGQNRIPIDIYENITITVTPGATSQDWTISLYALGTSEYYTGNYSFNIVTQKLNVSDINWSKDGNYDTMMAANVVRDIFLNNNVAGEHGIPESIYDHTSVDVTGGPKNWTVTITVPEEDPIYVGPATINIVASNYDISQFAWSTSGNGYTAQMTDDQYIAEFKNINAAGKNGLPNDIYDPTNGVDIAITEGTGRDRTLTITAKNTSVLYKGQVVLSIAFDKADLDDTTYWTAPTTCNAAMTNEQIAAEFIKANEEGQHSVPTGIYDEVDVKATGSVTTRSVVVVAKSTSEHYRGTKTISLTVSKFDVSTYDWDLRGIYTVAMTDDEFIQEFKILNDPAIKPNLPTNIYDNVKLTVSGEEENRIITVTAIGECYTGEIPIDLTVYIANVIYYDNVAYKLANDIDPNNFVTTGTPTITVTKYNEAQEQIELTITDWTKLQALILQRVKSDVTEINDNFLKSCTNLETVDLYGFKGITKIGKNFLSECYHLTKVKHINGLENVKTISDCFMAYCYNITSIDLSPLVSLQSIGIYFMFACEKLQFINLNGLNSLTYIDDYFLGWDNNLVELDLSGLNWNSIIVGQRFLFKCNGLNEIYLPTAANTSENFVNALRSEIAYNGYWLDSNQGKFYVSAGESGSWKTALGYTDEQAAAHIVEA